jgi:type III pantothenate kinase
MATPPSSADNILAIDAGNTRVKWGLFASAGVVLEHGACLNTEIAHAKLPETTHVIISNVAGDKVKKQLESLLPKNISIYWIVAKAKNCGVSNCYAQPEKLGADRWAALIASWHIKQAPCVVVNAGTAVTIDALSTNNNHAEFIGGLILPGFNLMQQSLGLATAQLPMPTFSANKQHHDIFAKNTTDAIRLGALQAISGAIILMANALETECKKVPNIIISGGNAQVIKDNLLGDVTNHVLIIDNLVLQGLYLIGNFMQSEPQ